MTPILRLEETSDHSAVRQVNRLAFGRDDESHLVDASRDGGHVRASLVAEEDGLVVGYILFSDLAIMTAGGPVAALALAPVGVIPSHERRGIGSRLVVEGLKACAVASHEIVVVVGHPVFYPRFGFSATLAERLVLSSSGPAFMAIELVPGVMANFEGEVRYTSPFEAF